MSKLTCNILGVNQRVDFSKGEVVSSVVIELEPGVVLELEASGDKSDFLIQYYSAKVAGVSVEDAVTPEQDVEQDVSVETAVLAATAAQAPPVRGTKVIAIDSMGNPIMRPADPPPMATIEEEVDEDGVAQA